MTYSLLWLGGRGALALGMQLQGSCLGISNLYEPANGFFSP